MKREIQRNVRLPRERDGKSAPPRRLERVLLANRFLNRVMAKTAQGVLTAMIWPRFVAPYRWELTRHTLKMAGLDRGLAGFRILQLTDLHVGKTRFSYLMGVVEKCLQEKPDLVVITGDLIDYRRDALPLIEKLLERVVAGMQNHGDAGGGGGDPGSTDKRVVAIFGNHDYHEYSWRHVGERSARRTIHRRLVSIVEKSGVHLLRNEQMRVRAPGGQPGGQPGGGGGELVIVGMDEMWTGRVDAEKAFSGLTGRNAVLCLQHNPDGVELLKRYPWQVMLCGHSHGGQARFPVVGALYVPMENRELLSGFFRYPLVAGQAKELGARRMFVSRGLGHSTPIRWGCRPEATVFTLSCV